MEFFKRKNNGKENTNVSEEKPIEEPENKETKEADTPAEEVSEQSVEQPQPIVEVRKEERQNIGGLEVVLDKSKSVSEQAEDMVEAAATAAAVEDDELVQDLTDIKKDELKHGFEAKLKRKQSESANAETELQKANYGNYQGIAELIGLKKPLPNATLKALMLILQPILVVYYAVVGSVTGIINITMECVNSIAERFVEFTKSAKKIIVIVFLIALITIIILVILAILRKYQVIV